jgi:hypothetical protein
MRTGSTAWRALGAAVLAALATTAPALAQNGDATFKDWWVACDNVRVCTALGLAPDEGYGVVLRVSREAEAGAAPSLDIGIDAETSKGVTGPLALAIDGKVLARTGPPKGADDDVRLWDVVDAQAPVLLAAMAKGDKIELKAGARTIGVVSLSGASAALRWMDDRQKRVGGVTALIAKGPAPAAAAPAPPPLPLIRAAAPVSQDGLTDTPPPAVRARTKAMDCEANPPEEPVSSRLAPGVVLWVMPCWVGAYQISSVLILADEKGGNVRLADVGGQGAGGGGDLDTRAMVTSASYDTDARKLSGYAKGRGIGDCGIGQTWAWTGKAFTLVEQTDLSVCRGLADEFWVTTFRSR